jgi:hypothetical protein
LTENRKRAILKMLAREIPKEKETNPMEVWRVNLRERSLNREAVPEAWSRLGGRGRSRP